MIFKKLFHTITLFIFFVFAQHENVVAKEYPMQHYSFSDGLPSNTIYDIYQAPDGLLWIGTDKGVSRFNGIRFENFSTADGLSDNECFYFRPDKEGRLWIATYNGKLCFYKNGGFYNESNTPYLKLPKATYYRDIKILEDGVVAFYSILDPTIFLLNKNKMSSFSNSYMQQKSKALIQIWNVEKISSNKMKLLYQDELVVLNAEKVLDRVKINPQLRNRLFTYDKNYYLNDNYQILDGSLKSLTIKAENKIKNHFVYRFIKHKGHELTATSRGLFVDSLEVILPNEVIHSIIINRAGDYCIGTKKNGLYILSKDFKFSIKIPKAYNEPVILAYNNNGAILFATEQGNLNKATGNTVDCIYNTQTFFKDVGNRKIKCKTGNKYIEKPEIGYFKTFLYKLVYGNQLPIKKVKPLDNLKTEEVSTMSATSKSILWTDSFGYTNTRSNIGFFKREEILNSRSEFNLKSFKINSGTEATFGFCKGINNDIWVSTLKSVYRIKDTVATLQPQFGAANFREMYFIQNRIVGISHSNELLICSDIKANKISIDTIARQNCIWDKIYPINDSTVLISNNNYSRIFTIFPSSSQFKYNISVLENPFIPYQSEYIYTDTNNAYFFKNGDLSIYPKSYLLQKQALPSVNIKSVSTEKEIYYTRDRLELEYNQARILKIKINPISFYHQNLSYQYTLSQNDVDENWIDFAGEELNLIKMNFGNYTIKIRAQTLSGDYSTPDKFYLIIKKPFWATWWFLTIVLTFISIIILIIARVVIKKKLQKKDNEVRFLRSEFKAMNALMNPHFIFNSLNSLQSLVNNNENSKASKYLRTFSDLIRQNMKNISKELITLENEIDLVRNYLQIEKLRFKNNLNYNLEVSEEVEVDLILIPPLLIQPLVENAIKHGIWPHNDKEGFLNIQIYESLNTLIVSIRDNGHGFSSKSESDTMHESYAITNIQSRIKQLSQIHQKKIEISIEEIKDELGTVLGVQSTILIHLDDFYKKGKLI